MGPPLTSMRCPGFKTRTMVAVSVGLARTLAYTLAHRASLRAAVSGCGEGTAALGAGFSMDGRLTLTDSGAGNGTVGTGTVSAAFATTGAGSLGEGFGVTRPRAAGSVGPDARSAELSAGAGRLA